jgi:hypothetical protein
LRINYRSFPLRNRGIPEQTHVWRPILPVKIIYGHATSKRFVALVDTGTDYCLFDALIGASIGIKIDKGPEGDLGGIIAGAKSKVYYHNIKLVVGADIVEIKAGFSWDLTENLLGQIGFFDHFVITFNAAFEPPCFDISREQRH